MKKTVGESSAFNDRLGMLSSGLCLLHCLAMPLLLSLQTSLHLSAFEGLHYVFLFLSFYAVFQATNHHTKAPYWTKALLWLAFVLLAVSVLFEEDCDLLHEVGIAASVLLIIAHFVNMRYCRKCA